MNEIELPGCTPEPLMSYLKALGVFRLVAEQKDPRARLSWRGGIAVLQTGLDRDALVQFFLEEYKPTPVVVPWSGGDFFGIDPKKQFSAMKEAPTSTAIIEAFLASKTDRLAEYRETIQEVVRVMDSCSVATKSAIEGAAGKKNKARFITQLRSNLSDATLFWIDAAALAEESGTGFNPLLGSGGGSDGNTHFSDNFMQNLWDCLPDFDSQRKTTQTIRPSVRNALFNELDGSLVKRTGALYDSGAVGGPNATQGLLREFLLNPWDFILALEGCSAFAGGMAKRHGSFSAETPSFPFIVRMIAVGFASAVIKEYGQQEVWLPLWKKPWTYGEHQTLMREGRAQLGRRPAGTGTEFARAIRTLGVNVGIDEFSRYGVIRGRVGGENYNTAAHLGIYRVGYDKTITLLDDIDPWLQKLSRAVRDEDLPQRYRVAIARLDAAIDSACRVHYRDSFINVLREIGKVERTFANGLTVAKKQGIKPISGLSSQWLAQANDGTAEFRLAASLAGIQRSGDVGPLRSFLEEVEVTNFVNWQPGSTSAVWSQQSLASNLAAVFRRRQFEAYRTGISGVPIASKVYARLDDVITFFHRETDDEKLADLIWGLIGIDWRKVKRVKPEYSHRSIPAEYGILRLIVHGLKFETFPGKKTLRWKARPHEDAQANIDLDVFHTLGRAQPSALSDSVTKAARRLKSGGLNVTGYRNRRHAGERLDIVSTIEPTRLLAAMLFPLSNRDLSRIANSVLYPPRTGGMTVPIDFDQLKKAPRILIEAALRPVAGTRIQPTGFPDLGAATYDAPDGQGGVVPTLLVESAQSMANRLEAVCWDEGADELVPELKGLPYIRVKLAGLGDGTDTTTSIQEFHRLNSPYIMSAVTAEGASFADAIRSALGMKGQAKKAPKKGAAEPAEGKDKAEDDSVGVVNLRKLAEVCFKYDPNSLVHGVFLEKIAGRLRHPRVLSSFIEASGVGRADSGGVKFDRALPKPSVAGVEAKGGYGNVPFHRTEFTAKTITAFFSVDLAQIRGYGLPEPAGDFLVALSLWKVRRFLDSNMRLRTACELELTDGGLTGKRPKGFELPDDGELTDKVKELQAKCAKLFATPNVTELTWNNK